MAKAWVPLFFLQFHFSPRFHQRKMAFVLSIFPWLLFTLWYCVLMNTEWSSGIWLFFIISDYVEETLCRVFPDVMCVILVIIQSYSRGFYKLGAYLLKKKFPAAIKWNVFRLRCGLECLLEFCSHCLEILRGWRQWKNRFRGGGNSKV